MPMRSLAVGSCGDLSDLQVCEFCSPLEKSLKAELPASLLILVIISCSDSIFAKSCSSVVASVS